MKSPSSISRGRNRLQPPVLALGAAAVSVLLASCSGSGAGAGAVAAPNVLERSADSPPPAWDLIVDSIAQPAVADGVVLVYAKGSGLNAHAVSVADGKPLWSLPIHPGIGASGVELGPELTKTAAGASAAVFLQSAPAPVDSHGIAWWTAPIAVDLKTGRELHRGESQLVTSRPRACDDEKDMCYTSMDGGTGQSVEHRVDLTTGAVLSGSEVNPLVGSFRLVGEGLYSVLESSGRESLARVSGGKELWAVDVKSLFGAGATTNLGWTFRYSKKLDLYVGTVGSNPTTETDYAKLRKDGFTVDLTKRKTVGFRASTGEALWTVDGAEIWCSSSLGTSATKLEDGDALPVRCEFPQGSQKLPGGTYENAMAKLVGYDPLTGNAAWQTEPMAPAEAKDLMIPIIGRGDTVLGGSKDGLKLINTQNGQSRATKADDIFLCSKAAKYPLPVNPPFTSLPEDNEGSGGDIAFPCDKDGNSAPALTGGAIRDIRTVDGGTAVVALDGKITAYKLP